MVTLGEGWTPLLDLPRLADVFGVDKLWLKDDSLLPTGTFKARGAAVGVSCAVERNVRGVALPTNGNAGAAWAAYAARAGISVRVVMPGDAPAITRAECTIVGADLSIVDGDISDAAAIVRGFREADWYDVATLNEPYRLEGKKTMTLELVEQLGWRVPDVVVYPTGGGIGLIALYKALSELIELELIENRLPRVVAVQAAGCAPIVRAFEAGTTVAEPWENARTVAFGITVPKPLGDFMILEALRATRGCATAVSDAELLRAQEMCGHEEGVFVCPEGAAAIAAVHQLRARGWIMPSEEVIVVNTGTGLKYPHTVVANARTVERRPTPAGFDR
jgi:threonine synthase